ncbi:MAG: DUF3558 domain-containing protein, partial [Actinomycetota bacterium]|nr:DUF3558 domain-containing protein [Actinomycetota bacterium]
TLVLAGLVAGCGQQVTGTPSEPSGADPSGSALASFDACTLLSDVEISTLGFRPETREPTDLLGLVDCKYLGPTYGPLGGLRVEKEVEETVADYEARSESFDVFRENEVNGRRGAAIELVDDGIECAQIVNAGSGTVQVGWEFREAGPVDPCAEAMRVMTMIEPELPAVGS